MTKEEYRNIDIFLNRKRAEGNLFTVDRSSGTNQSLDLEEDYFNSSLVLDNQESVGFEKNLEQQIKKERNRFEQETVAVLSLGARNSLVESVAYQIRKLKVYSEVFDFSDPALDPENFEQEFKSLNLKGIILCVENQNLSPENQEKQKDLYTTIFNLNVPVLGVGAAIREIATFFGGKVSSTYLNQSLTEADSTKAKLFLDPDSPLFSGIESEISSLMVTSEQISALPQGFKVIGHTSKLPIAAISDQEKQIYALQVHPKTLSNNYKVNEILANFLHQICDCGVSWDYSRVKSFCIQEIQAQTKNGKVFFEFKNNLESLALCLIMNEAIGQRFACVLIDHGLANSNQNKKLVQFLRNSFRLKAYYIDAREFFFKELEHALENKQKQQIIRQLSEQILEKKISEIGSFDFLADYSTYQDLMKQSDNLLKKTDYSLSKMQISQLSLEEKNRINLPVIKPFERLFSDELKEIVKNTVTNNILVYLENSLSDEGFACAVSGKVTPEKIDLISKANNLLQEELQEQNQDSLQRKIKISLSLEEEKSINHSETRRFENKLVDFNAEAELPSQKENKSYSLVIKIKKEKAQANLVSFEFFDRLAFRFMNELPSINKIFYDITPDN